jgi:gamma-glutamylcyclotransferase (GGCT)/AIG2-like uncharacterized protein YtfP
MNIQQAKLYGYKRVKVIGRGYPVAVVGTRQDCVTGEIHEVDVQDLAILDQYEGLDSRLYDRVPCKVVVIDQETSV